MEINVDGLIVLVDGADFILLGKPKLAVYADNRGGCQHVRICGQKESLYLHREIFGPIPDGYVVDHINGNVLDNRRCNLRLATIQQNARNNIAGFKGKSKYPGVSWYSKYNKWRAAISINGNKKHLGYYKDELTAARAAKEASLEIHGEFSVYNNHFKEL